MAEWSLGTVTHHRNTADPEFSYTVGEGADRVLVLCMGFRNGDITGARYNGVAMTEIGDGAGAPSSANGRPASRAWFLVNPPVGTHGFTYDFATASSNLRPAGFAVALYGINQTTPHRTPSINNDQSDSATSSYTLPISLVDDLVLDFLRIGANSSSSAHAAGSGQTQLGLEFADNGHVGMSYKTGLADETPMGWTWTGSNRVAHIAVAFIPAGELEPPDGTVTIGTTETKSTSLKFTFSDTSTNATGYEYRIDGGTPVDIGNPSPKEHKTFGLTPSTTYDSPGLQVRAYNADGPGEWSTAVPFSTIATAAPVFARLNRSMQLQTQLNGENAGSGSQILPMRSSFEMGATSALFRHRKPITKSMAVRRPFIVVTANDKTAPSTITLIDDDVATDVSITIPAGEIGIFRDEVNEHTFNGSTEGWWFADHGDGGIYTGVQFGYETQPTDDDLIVTFIGPHSSGEIAFGSASATYLLPIGTRNTSSTEAQAELRALFPAIIRDLRVAGSNGQTDPFTGTALVGFRKGGVDTAVVATWDSANETDGSARIMVVVNTVDTASVTPGDEITLFARPNEGATGSTRDVTWFGTMESDNSGGAGEFLLAMGSTEGTGTPISAGTYYAPIAGEAMYTSTEAIAQTPMLFDTRLYRFTVRAGNDHTGTATITLRKNGEDTDLSLTLGSGDAGVTKQFPIDEFEDFAEGDLISYKVDVTSTGLRIQYVAIAGAAIAEPEPVTPTPYQPMMMSPF